MSCRHRIEKVQIISKYKLDRNAIVTSLLMKIQKEVRNVVLIGTYWLIELINHLKQTMVKIWALKLLIETFYTRRTLLKIRGKLILSLLYSDRNLSWIVTCYMRKRINAFGCLAEGISRKSIESTA